jgi:hypothetical protein
MTVRGAGRAAICHTRQKRPSAVIVVKTSMIHKTGTKIADESRATPKSTSRSARSMRPPLAASPRLSAFDRW